MVELHPLSEHPHSFALGVCFGAFCSAVGVVALSWLIAAVVSKSANNHLRRLR